MAPRFPLYIDLSGNNCIVFGGGEHAAERAKALLQFGAKVTVISPHVCKELQIMDKKELIRYIPRRYYRGDCTNSYLCVAATDDENVNVAISDECKAKSIAINIVNPAPFGTFAFPTVILNEGITVSLECQSDEELAQNLQKRISEALPQMLDDIRQQQASSKE